MFRVRRDPFPAQARLSRTVHPGPRLNYFWISPRWEEYLQSLSGLPVPMISHLHRKYVSNVQAGPSVLHCVTSRSVLGIAERKLGYFFRSSLQILSHWWNLPKAFSSSDWTIPTLVSFIHMLFVRLSPLFLCLIHQSCTENPKTAHRLHVWPHKCWLKEKKHLPQLAGNNLPPAAQDSFCILWDKGTLLVSVSVGIPRVYSAGCISPWISLQGVFCQTFSSRQS